MIVNKSSIEEILEDNFWDDIYSKCVLYIEEIDSDTLWDKFENFVDYAELDSIYSLNVINYDINMIRDEIEVVGTFEINTDIDGFSYFDGEIINSGSGEIKLIMDFMFYIEKHNKFCDFQINEVYF